MPHVRICAGGAGQPAFLPQPVKVIRVKNGTARSASEAIIAALYPLRRCVDTITYDNGSEFAEHQLIDTALGTLGFFADPHSPWQRGTNENMAIPFLEPMD